MNISFVLADEDDAIRITNVQDVRIDCGALWIREKGSSMREGRETILADGVWREARIDH